MASTTEKLAALLPTGVAGGLFTGLRIDTRAPKSAVPAQVPASGVYAAGQTLDFVVKFTEPVIVTGSPRIAVKIGKAMAYADYVSGSGGANLEFRYTVQAADATTPKKGILIFKKVELPGAATVQDAMGNAAKLSFSVPSTAKIVVAGSAIG